MWIPKVGKPKIPLLKNWRRQGRGRGGCSTQSPMSISRSQHDPIMSPLIWDYGHIGIYE
jgi:hypothetical protein